MNLLKRFTSSDESVVMVGGDDLSVVKTRKPLDQYAFVMTLMLCLLSAVLCWHLFGQALERSAQLTKESFSFEKEEEALQQNGEALKSLIAQEERIREQQSLVEEALPFGPQYQLMVAFFEDRVDAVSEEHSLRLPEHISWRRVLESDVSNEELQELGIYQYAFQLEGDYEGMLAFLREMRQSRRLIDLRSLQNFQRDAEGLVSADLTFWTYHIL